MYISKITLHNFKGFKGDHELVFDVGINFFVGDSNCAVNLQYLKPLTLYARRKAKMKLLRKMRQIPILFPLKLNSRGKTYLEVYDKERLKES
jgi:hypothetical protein